MSGRVYWITGLSGAGKTTVASALYQIKRKNNENIVFLDGDALRKTIANDLGYNSEERFMAAMRYSRLCKMLSDQDINVIIATIAMFHSIREWNRINIKDYKEIYLKVSFEVLEKRNQNKLYSGAKNGAISNVVGIDLAVEEPRNPDLIINNNGIYTVSECVDMILKI